MERERTGGLPATAPVAADPTGLYRLIDAALKAEGMDRFVAAGKLNDLLIAMRAPGDEAAEAEAILAALDVSSLDGLVDGHGRNCRKEAVETLLACGFPHALHVSPEDLAHARRRPLPARQARPVTPAPDAVKVAAWTTIVSSALQALGAFSLFRHDPLLGVAMGLSAVMIGVGGWSLGQLRSGESLGPSFAFLATGVIGGFAAQGFHLSAPSVFALIGILLSAAMAAAAMPRDQ